MDEWTVDISHMVAQLHAPKCKLGYEVQINVVRMRRRCYGRNLASGIYLQIIEMGNLLSSRNLFIAHLHTPRASDEPNGCETLLGRLVG